MPYNITRLGLILFRRTLSGLVFPLLFLFLFPIGLLKAQCNCPGCNCPGKMVPTPSVKTTTYSFSRIIPQHTTYTYSPPVVYSYRPISYASPTSTYYSSGPTWFHYASEGTQNRQSLIMHLSREHGINPSSLSHLSYNELRRIHSNAHNERKTTNSYRPVRQTYNRSYSIFGLPVYRSQRNYTLPIRSRYCPNGNCPL